MRLAPRQCGALGDSSIESLPPPTDLTHHCFRDGAAVGCQSSVLQQRPGRGAYMRSYRHVTAADTPNRWAQIVDSNGRATSDPATSGDAGSPDPEAPRAPPGLSF